ncbi:MAG: hypothetical protein ACK47B_21580 [Armatimonadota bacterium]
MLTRSVTHALKIIGLTALAGAAVLLPAQAAGADPDDGRRGEYRGRYDRDDDDDWKERQKRRHELEREHYKREAEREKEWAKREKERRKELEKLRREREKYERKHGRSYRSDRYSHPRVTVRGRRTDLDRDGIPNSRDRDIDGDRVPNTRDRHPYDRRRR